MSKRTIGFVVYYVLFALFVLIGFLLDWELQTPIAILLLVEILCCLGTGGDLSFLNRHHTKYRPVDPEAPLVRRDLSSLPLVTSLLIVLPPILFFVIYTAVWLML